MVKAFQVNGLSGSTDFPVMRSDDAPGALFSREQPITLHRVGSRELAQPENDRLPLLHHLRRLDMKILVPPPPFIHADLSAIVPLSWNKRGGRITSKCCD